MLVNIIRKEKVGGIRVVPGVMELPDAIAEELMKHGAAEAIVGKGQLVTNVPPDRDILIRN